MASEAHCSTCIAEQVTSVVNDVPWPVISRTQAYMEMAKFVRSALKTMFYSPEDPDSVISDHRDSSHVRHSQLTVCPLDFADSISAGHFDFNRLYSTTVNKVWCLLCGQIF